MTRVLVGIPWRSQPHRVYAHDLTVRRYRDLLGGNYQLSVDGSSDVVITDVDTTHEPFCLAACRNEIVRRAEAGGYDVAVLGDADTLPEQAPLLAAIEGAAEDGLVHLPYDRYHSLRQDGTDQHLTGTPLEACNHLVVDGACSGVYVTTPATWWAHGGQDEVFLGWGFEDAAWWSAHKTLLGAVPVRHAGTVFALHHDGAVKDGPQYTANAARCFRYHQAEGDPTAMRELIAEQQTTTLA